MWIWSATSAAFLIWHRPLWAHDVVLLTVSLAVASGVGLATWLTASESARRAAAFACLLAMAVLVALHSSRTVQGESGGVRWAAGVLGNYAPPRSKVVSDWPIISVFASRSEPGQLVDTSWTRLASGWLPRGAILRTIDLDRVTAVVVALTLAPDQKLRQA